MDDIGGVRNFCLKTDPEPFTAVFNGHKTYELRLDDRGYAKGDKLALVETQHTGADMKAGAPLVLTGRMVVATVTHVLKGPVYGLLDGWAILSLRIDSVAVRAASESAAQ